MPSGAPFVLACASGSGSYKTTTHPEAATVIKLPASTWTRFAEQLFEALGVPQDEASRVARSLVDANLCGHDSHGLIRVIQYSDALRDRRTVPGAPFKVVKETAGVLVVD